LNSKLSLAILAGLSFFIALTLSLGNLNYQFYYAYQPYTMRLTMLSESLDIVIWLISALPLAIASLIYAYRKRLYYWTILLIGSLIAIIFIFLAWLKGLFISPFQLVSAIPAFFFILKAQAKDKAISLIAFLMPPFIITMASAIIRLLGLIGLPIDSISLLNIDLQLFYLAYPIGIYLLIIIIFAWLWVWFLKPIKPIELKIDKTSFFLLGFAIGLSILIAYLPYIASPAFIGVDTEWYLSALSNSFSLKALIAPRGLYLGILKAISTIIGINQSIKIGFAILGVLHALAVYLLVSYGLNKHAGALASIFTTFPAMISLYAGIYANWLSFSLMVLSFYFFLNAIEKNSKMFFVLCVFSLALTALNHPWTGGIAIVIYTLMLLTFFFIKGLKHSFILFLAFFIGLASILSFQAFPIALFALNALNPKNVFRFPLNLSYTLKFYIGGFFDTPLFYLLCLFGILNIPKAKKIFKLFLMIWLMVCSLLITFSSLWMVWRILYLMPFQILAGLGINWLTSFMLAYESSSKILKIAYGLLISLIILIVFNYALRGIGLLLSQLNLI